MKNITGLLYISFGLLVCTAHVHSLPPVNLGSTNILDGGPTRPNPGWYLLGSTRTYHSDTLFDHCGNVIPHAPTLNLWTFLVQGVYQTKGKWLNRISLGVDATLPMVLFSQVSANPLGITTSGSGLSNLNLGIYLQWDPIMHNDRPLFVHRLDFNAFLKTGKWCFNKTINPAVNFLYIDPYWAATLFITHRFGCSWRLHYLWCGTNHCTQEQDGDAIHLNYSFEYQATKHMYIALTGYFLQQLHNSKLCSVPIPNTKERVFGIGPGALYAFSQDSLLFGYLYFERAVRNRPQGVSFLLRYAQHF
jgi:hypothetical protein